MSSLGHLAEARRWLLAGQRGDPNGAKCFQADKCVFDAVGCIEAEIAAARLDAAKRLLAYLIGHDPAPEARRFMENTDDAALARIVAPEPGEE